MHDRSTTARTAAIGPAAVINVDDNVIHASACWEVGSPDQAVDPHPQRPEPVAAAAEAPDRHVVFRMAVGPDAGQQRGQRQREQRSAQQQRRRRGRPEEAARAAAEQREEV